MSGTIRVNCSYGIPAATEGVAAAEWLRKLNSSFHPPHALIDGRETSVHWDEPTDIDVQSGKKHKLEVYFSVFDVLRVCTAEIEIEPLRDGETRSYRYDVELKDRYLDRGHLRVE